jgi:hypothetical protein
LVNTPLAAAPNSGAPLSTDDGLAAIDAVLEAGPLGE